MKILNFEGAGWSGADTSTATVGNCRIRTAFHLDDGRPVFLELCAAARTKNSDLKLYKLEYTGFVETCFLITNDIPNDDENKHSLMHLFREKETELVEGYYDSHFKMREPDQIRTRYLTRAFCYSEDGILNTVNGLGASFDAIRVVPDLGGYRVFPEKRSCWGRAGYNYGDRFRCDPELTARRQEVYRHYYNLERAEELEYPTFSLWVVEGDPGALHLLRHFPSTFRASGNKHWIIRVDKGNCLSDWLNTATETFLGKYGC